MSSLQDHIRATKQSPPLASLLVVIVVVAILSSVSFAAFWYSDTKDLVKTIQQTSRGQTDFQTPATGIEADGVLKVSELLFIIDTVDSERAKLNPEVDFGGGALQQSNLGF